MPEEKESCPDRCLEHGEFNLRIGKMEESNISLWKSMNRKIPFNVYTYITTGLTLAFLGIIVWVVNEASVTKIELQKTVANFTEVVTKMEYMGKDQDRLMDHMFKELNEGHD